MKKIFLPLFITFLFVAGCNNNKEKTVAPDYDYLVSMDGIGPIKLDMTQEELEKLLNKKIPLTNPTDTVSGSWQDTATVNYKDIELKLDFQRSYTREDTFYMRIIDIETSSPLAKTSSGLSIGTGKSTIIDAYETHTINMGPDYNQEDTTNSNRRYLIGVRDDWRTSREIIFCMVNKKVVAIKVSVVFSDSE